jgi:hypothetical protein
MIYILLRFSLLSANISPIAEMEIIVCIFMKHVDLNKIVPNLIVHTLIHLKVIILAIIETNNVFE